MDEQEVRRVVKTYADMIKRISYNYLQSTYDCEDICQTVFLKFMTAESSFTNKEHEKAWFIRTTINACHDLRKSSFFRKTVELTEAADKGMPKIFVSMDPSEVYGTDGDDEGRATAVKEVDGITYILMGFDLDMTADELFGMAEEMLAAK